MGVSLQRIWSSWPQGVGCPDCFRVIFFESEQMRVLGKFDQDLTDRPKPIDDGKGNCPQMALIQASWGWARYGRQEALIQVSEVF